MPNPSIEQFEFDFDTLREQNPDSLALALETGAYQDPRRDNPDDWGHRLQKDLAAGNIRPVAAVAVYLQHQGRGKQRERTLEIAGKLTVGQPVVGYEDGVSTVDAFKESESGILDSGMTLAGFDEYRYDMTFHIAGRKAPTVTPIGNVRLAVGSDEITSLYSEQLDPDRVRKAVKDGLVSGDTYYIQERLQNTAIMQQLGLIRGNEDFEQERNAVTWAATQLTEMSKIFPKGGRRPNEADPRTHFIRLLPNLHILDKEVARARIQEIGVSQYVENEAVRGELAHAVAQIRAPYALSSLEGYAKISVEKRAEADVYEMRAKALGEL